MTTSSIGQELRGAKTVFHPHRVVELPACVYSVKFNPFVPSLLAVGTAQNFGVAGDGFQHIIVVPKEGPSQIQSTYVCHQAVLDTAWSEASPNIVGSSLGNGIILLFDIKSRKKDSIGQLQGHTRECGSIEWNIQHSNLLLSTSWDMSVRLWDVEICKEVLCLPGVHRLPAYCASWCPSQPSIFASCGSDGLLRVLDARENSATRTWTCKSIGMQAVLSGEALSLDWNKFNPFLIASCGTDHEIRLWDIRKFKLNQQGQTNSLSTLRGHLLAVSRIKWSPFREAILASASYDMSTGIWDCRQTKMIFQYSHHTEFVKGLDWDFFENGLITSGSWDRTVAVWNAFSNEGPTRPPR